MTRSPFAHDLIVKSKRALKTARLDLQDGDTDGSVNRSYYAMFNIARAALLAAGVVEKNLPRTHSGLIGSFAQHAVHTGRIDAETAAALGRAETSRLRADYTGDVIDAKEAADTVERAEKFVVAVDREFGLSDRSTELEFGAQKPPRDDQVSEPGVEKEIETSQDNGAKPYSMAEVRRQARENWLRFRAKTLGVAKQAQPRNEADRDRDNDRGLSDDSDLES